MTQPACPCSEHVPSCPRNVPSDSQGPQGWRGWAARRGAPAVGGAGWLHPSGLMQVCGPVSSTLDIPRGDRAPTCCPPCPHPGDRAFSTLEQAASWHRGLSRRRRKVPPWLCGMGLAMQDTSWAAAWPGPCPKHPSPSPALQAPSPGRCHWASGRISGGCEPADAKGPQFMGLSKKRTIAWG